MPSGEVRNEKKKKKATKPGRKAFLCEGTNNEEKYKLERKKSETKKIDVDELTWTED